MNRIVACAAILSVGLTLAAFTFAGRYAVVGSRDRIVYIVDRFTGTVRYCVPAECRSIAEAVVTAPSAAKKGSSWDFGEDDEIVDTTRIPSR